MYLNAFVVVENAFLHSKMGAYPDLHADKVADAEYPEPVGDPSRLRGVGGVALDPS